MREIIKITPGSPIAKRRAPPQVAPGDILLSINGHEINDVLDYRFYAAEKKLRLRLKRGERERSVTLRKGEYDDPGLEFADGLMDSQRHCKNKCVFCFIDQLPPGLRESLYFKDDDARLGFLFGNYITLTRLVIHDIERMAMMKLSPVNVSIHTMNPALRCRMMGNPKAGESLDYLNALASAGLDLNIQLVLCPGWNDGEELRFTLRELLKLPTVRSIAAVPVGLTRYREGLAELRAFTKEEAQEVIEIFEEFREYPLSHATRASSPKGEPELCCSDEFFLIAEREMPGVEYYGEFRQIENGVGLWASLRRDTLEALHNCQLSTVNCQLTLVTGIAAEPLLRFLVDETQKIWHNININVRAIENAFFGPSITVAGLLTGVDVIDQLREECSRSSAAKRGARHMPTRPKGASQVVLLPGAMFNHDGLTLDGLTCDEIGAALGVPVKAVANDAEALLEAICNTPSVAARQRLEMIHRDHFSQDALAFNPRGRS